MRINVTIFIIKKNKLFDFLHPKEVHKNAQYIATGGLLLVLSFKIMNQILDFTTEIQFHGHVTH